MSIIKTYFKLLKHDVYSGFSENKAKYLFSALAFIMLCAMVYFLSQHLLLEQTDGSGVPYSASNTIADYLAFIFKGIEVYLPNSEEPFKIPIFWAILQILIALLVCNYPTKDLDTFAKNILIRVKSKRLWWNSKCLWIVLSVSVFYLLCLIIVVLFTTVLGSVSFDLTTSVSETLMGVYISPVAAYNLMLAFLVPLFVSIALSLLQMLLSFALKPMFSFIIVIAYCIVSAYLHTPFLIADYSMLLRNGLVYDGGLSSATMIGICLGFSVAVIVIGNFYANRMDLLPKEG